MIEFVKDSESTEEALEEDEEEEDIENSVSDEDSEEPEEPNVSSKQTSSSITSSVPLVQLLPPVRSYILTRLFSVSATYSAQSCVLIEILPPAMVMEPS